MLPRITARLALLRVLASPLLCRPSFLCSRTHADELSRASGFEEPPMLRSIQPAAPPPVGKANSASRTSAMVAIDLRERRSRLLSPDAKTQAV